MSSAIYPDPPRLVTAVCGHGEQQRLSNARLRANVAPSVRHNARSPIAGSFLGGFRTPATVHLASPAWPASETLHTSRLVHCSKYDVHVLAYSTTVGDREQLRRNFRRSALAVLRLVINLDFDGYANLARGEKGRVSGTPRW